MSVPSRARPFILALGAVALSAAAAMRPDAGEAATVERHRPPPDFEINQGQSDPRVVFLAHGARSTLFLTSDGGAAIRLSPPRNGPARAGRFPAGNAPVVTTRWLGASPAPAIEGLEPLESKSNYFIGNDPSRWRTNVPHYARVRYRGLYPGIDLVYYGHASTGYGHASTGGDTGRGDAQGLEYDLIVAPGGDPGVVRLAVDGVESAAVDGRGDLRLTTAAGVIVQRRPVIYQEIDGARRPVAGSYALRPVRAAGGGPKGRCEIGIDVASYDATRPLVIDPILDLSTYWGGGGNDTATAVSVDINTGAVFLAGYTDSSDFPIVDPVAGASVPAAPTPVYAFVTRLTVSQNSVGYSTFIGGTGTTRATGLDVDGSGAAYVTGWTDATDFPIVPNDAAANNVAYQVNYGGGSADAFVLKIDNKGNALTYSTYLGGTGSDQANAVKTTGGNAYVTGTTASTDFPTQVPWQSAYGGGASDVFVAKVDNKGRSLLFSTYLGGSGEEQGLALALGSGGVSTVTGWTNSNNFPTHAVHDTAAPLQADYHGGTSDAFVARFSGDGKTLVYSTYLGGSGDDVGNAVVLDAGETAFVTGFTTSKISDPFPFPTEKPIQLDNNGNRDLFISRLDSSGETLRFSTYLGGSSDDVGYGIARSPEGFVYVTGETMSAPTDPTPFPILSPIQGSAYGGAGDAFLLRLTTDNQLDYSTYWGGGGEDIGRAIVIDNGAAYVTGTTLSTNLHTLNPIVLTNPSYDGGVLNNNTGSGNLDAFLLKVLDNQTSGCNLGPFGGPFARFDRIDLGLPVVLGAAVALWRVRRRRVRR